MLDILSDRRLLIIDDDRDFATSLADILEVEGYVVSLAHSVAESPDALLSSGADVVVLDLNLGDGNGVRLMQQMQGEHPDLQFIVLTAHASTNSVIDALRERVYDYLLKPVSPPNLLLSLERCFESIGLRRKTEAAEAQLASRNAELETLNRRLRDTVVTATELTAAIEPDASAEPEASEARLLETVARNVNAEGGSLFLLRDGRLFRAHAIDPAHVPEEIALSALAEGSLIARALKTGAPQFVANVCADESINRSGWEGYRDSSSLVFPLLGDDGEPFGVITLHNRDQPPFTDQDLDIGTIVVSLVNAVLRKRRAGDELRRSETRFRSLVEKSSDITTVVDRHGVVRYESPSVQTILGWDRGDLMGTRVLNLVHPDDHRRLFRMFAERMDGSGAVVHLEHTLRDNSGNYRILQSSITDLSGNPEVGGLVINSRDVTESKELEQRLQVVFERSPDALYLTDLEGVFVDSNIAARRLLGFDTRSLLGGSIFTCGVLREPDVRRMERLLRRAANESEPASAFPPDEFVLLRADGSEATAELLAHRLEIGRDPYILIVARDITSRRNAEKALSESETKYKALFDAAGDGIVMVDGDRFIDCNLGACTFFGLPREKLIGRGPAQLSPQVQPDGSLSSESAAEKIAAALSGDEFVQFEWRHLRGNGTPVDAEISLSRIELKGKAYVQGIIRDVTARKTAEERERQHERELFQAAKMVSLGTLVSGVAHEINNPNNFIRLSTENFAELWHDISATLRRAHKSLGPVSLKGIPLETAEKMVDSIIKGLSEGSVRIENLVKSLREYAQNDSGDLDQPVNINSVVESAQTIVRSVLEKATNRFSYEPARDLPPVVGNYHQIEQVVINLLANACQSLENPDQSITVRTAHDPATSRVSIEVCDEGEGITEENLLRITDPFYTTKRDIGGTGLGLSVSQRIVRNHGGELTFTSEPGKGTFARIALPVQRLG